MEVSRIEHLRQMADKAEMRALQSKINPHFLFNALNAISSSIRLNPDTARQLIINLSRYLRYNLELNDELIDIRKELHQIQDYIAIEQARFGAKLTVIYDIDDDVSVRIPSLLIQPLVENAIVHGIQPCKGKGVVVIAVKDQGDRVKISVKDTGHGINQETIDRVARNEMPGHNIGLLNVHHRVSLLYGEGLHIHRLEPGTEIAFYISKTAASCIRKRARRRSGGLMKAIIVEDEFLAQEELSYLIKKHSNIDIVASFEDGLDVLKYLQTHQVDAIFSTSTSRRWTACCWRKTSASSRIALRSCSSPPIKSTRWKRSRSRRSTTSSSPITRHASSPCCKSWRRCISARRRGGTDQRTEPRQPQHQPDQRRADHRYRHQRHLLRRRR